MKFLFKKAELPPDFNLVRQLYEAGKLEHALAMCKSLLEAKRDDFEGLHLLGSILAQQGQNEEALPYLRAALKLRPSNLAVLGSLGLAHARLGQFTEALTSFEKLLALDPTDIEALSRRGNVLMGLKRPAEALSSYDQALALKSDYLSALINRGIALMDLKRPAEALSCFEKALLLSPDDCDVLNNRGNALRDLKRPAEAVTCFEKAIAIRPDYALTFNNRGNALMDLKRPSEALVSYQKALILRPDYTDALINQGNALLYFARRDEALASFDKALAIKPHDIYALNNRGHALRDLHRYEDAVKSYETALTLAPAYAEAHHNKGLLLADLGQFEAAAQSIETAIKFDPKEPRFYLSLTECKRFKRDDSYLWQMEYLAQDVGSLTPDAQVELHFGLAKAYTDIGDQERSFQQLLTGNELKRSQIVYDEGKSVEFLEAIRAAFTKESMEKNHGPDGFSTIPIFIVGLPRSGSTLVEQILASHSQVFGAGQTNEFDKTKLDAAGAEVASNSPASLAHLSAEELRRLGTTYIDRVGMAAPAATHIVDKTLENFPFVGLIRKALPNARIIHTRRDPIDTCVSCFSILFGENSRLYTYDLGELGRYYRAYEAMMAHWSNLLPAGAMLEVQYEELVADLEGQTHRILDFCGLDWDSRCLDFHKTERPVRTASKAQVRQPLFTSSIGRWRAYKQHLGPLIEALGLTPPSERTEERS